MPRLYSDLTDKDVKNIFEVVRQRYSTNTFPTLAMENYITASCEGILKAMSKMGISVLLSYERAQVFGAIGLNDSLINKYFP